MTVTSGRRWLGLLQSYGLDGSLAKMCEALLTSRWGSSAAFLTWKALNTKPRHLLFQLAPSMPRTDATESGLWQTPTVSVAEHPGQVKHKPGQQLRLSQQVNNPHLWPTPDTRGFTNKGSLQMLAKKASSPEEMSRMAYRASAKMKQALWPTPTKQDASNNGGSSQYQRNTRPLNAEVGGSLNPAWVEWLMGFPTGWTDLKPSEMPSSRKSSSKLDEQ